MGNTQARGPGSSPCTRIRRERRLPLNGAVLVSVGQRVRPHDVVAEAELPGETCLVNVAGELGIAPDELPGVLLKKEGESLKQGDVLARTGGLLGLFQRECAAPLDGRLESASPVTGQVLIRGRPQLLRKLAYLDGTVVAVEERVSATVETWGVCVPGVFGLAGEAVGQLEAVVDSPDASLDAGLILPSHEGRVLVGGSLVTAEAVAAASACGVRGIVCGGLHDCDLRTILGYDLGIALTGAEELSVTIIITEGFGRLSMARGTFDTLCAHAGSTASINGATQVRAGVVRPEIIIPTSAAYTRPSDHASPAGSASDVLRIGARVRAIREPYFGRLGRCCALPREPKCLASEARARVLEVEFDDGTEAVLPRANVELVDPWSPSL
ncbi:MAG: hypothetical protein KKB50_17475 [Planctomycetes bacterium]|nr:hypothetical protein [Planctomycetota bacterium]